MRAVVVALVGAMVVTGPAWSQAAPAASCAAIDAAMQAQLKELSYVRFTALQDRSAVQGTQRAAEAEMWLSMIRANLDLMIAGRCPLPATPVTDQVYSRAAGACAMAVSDNEIRSSCNRAAWRPNAAP